MDLGLTESSLNIRTSLTPLKTQDFKLNSDWNMKINSQTLLGHSHHLLPLLKIFFRHQRGKPIYIANAYDFFSSSSLLLLKLKTAKAGESEKSGDFSFADNLETLSS